mgnify:CR=1 FL=1
MAGTRGKDDVVGYEIVRLFSSAPSTMLRMVPLPRFAGEDLPSRPASTWILPRLRGRGTAEGGGGGVGGIHPAASLTVLNLSALPTTKTLDIAMAPAASIGDKRMPKAGQRSPAATGISAVL